MGSFVNPGTGVFQTALNSEIYVDKTGLLEYTNKVMNTLQAYICNSGDLESRLPPICSRHITAEAVIQRKCLPGLKSANAHILRNI